MSEIIKINNALATEESENQLDLVKISDEVLAEINNNLASSKGISMPITEIATLGAGVSSLLPAFRTVTQSSSFGTEDLYRIANMGANDTLKYSVKNGNFWGAIKTTDGASKMAQLQKVDPISVTTQTVSQINPAMIMMAVALFSVEQKLGKIEETAKQIATFLEIEKESEIEADIQTLSKMINSYKHNWNNEHYIASNHKMVLDIQRTARKNMISYQKNVNEILGSKKLLVAQAMVGSTLKDLQKKFQYYRLSLYIYSMASLVEIMLSGNFNEDNISVIKDEVESKSLEYREAFSKCSAYIEKMSGLSIETNMLKGVGIASKAVGKFIGNIPVVKEGIVDEFLQDSGEKIKENAKGIEKNAVDLFAQLSNPETGVFVDRMQDMIQIYNHTSEICVDKDNVYLIA